MDEAREVGRGEGTNEMVSRVLLLVDRVRERSHVRLAHGIVVEASHTVVHGCGGSLGGRNEERHGTESAITARTVLLKACQEKEMRGRIGPTLILCLSSGVGATLRRFCCSGEQDKDTPVSERVLYSSVERSSPNSPSPSRRRPRSTA